jgi:hypothetical protein
MPPPLPDMLPTARFSGPGAVVPELLLEPLHPATPDAAARTAVIAATVLNRIMPPPIVGNQTGDRGGRFPEMIDRYLSRAWPLRLV